MSDRKTPAGSARRTSAAVLSRNLLMLVAAVTPPAAPPIAAAGDAAPQTRRAEVAPELRRIAEGYLKNRAAFRSFRCEFRFRLGRAGSLQEALKRGPTVKPLTASCTWILDGKGICYRRAIDKEAKAAMDRAKANPRPHVVKGQPGFIAEIPLSARGYLTDGTRALSYDPDFVVNLMGPKRIEELINGLSPDTTPWALGGMGRTMGSNPGRWILDGKWGKWRYAGAEDANGGKLMVVECRRETSRTRYYFDTRRGFLPIRREYRLTDGRRTHLAITDVRRCSGGRWFPARVVSIDMRAGGAVWRVQEITLTGLDADAKVKAEQMYLVLRRGIQVLHVDNMLSAFRLREAERVGINDLEALHTRCDAAAREKLRRRAERNRQ